MGRGRSVHCARYAGTLPIRFWLAFWCAFIRNANCTRAVFAFCFVLESCKPNQVRFERFCESLALQKTLLATEGSPIDKIPNVPQCTLLPRPIYQTLLFDFSRVWFRDYLKSCKFIRRMRVQHLGTNKYIPLVSYVSSIFTSWHCLLKSQLIVHGYLLSTYSCGIRILSTMGYWVRVVYTILSALFLIIIT